MNKKEWYLVILCIFIAVFATGCALTATEQDTRNTKSVGNKLTTNQPTPTDIEYSLERYNLIKRAYWVNGMREKALSLPCAIDRPLGYIVLFSGNAVVGQFIVDGKVSSLNSFLTPDSDYPTCDTTLNNWVPDVDGSYGENDTGVFFFTPDGNYIEWSGDYLYSDIPFTINNPVVQYEVKTNE